MGLGDVVDEFLNQHSLADTSTTEKTDLSTTSIRCEEVDNLNTGLQDLGGSRLVDERRGVGVDGGELDALDGTTLVNGLANDVHDTAEGVLADGNTDGCARVNNFLTTDETFRTVHSNRADGVLPEMGSHFKHKTTAVEVLDFEGI